MRTAERANPASINARILFPPLGTGILFIEPRQFIPIGASRIWAHTKRRCVIQAQRALRQPRSITIA